jgi:hypothetical protein
MTCRKVVKELTAYLAGELPERARSRVEAHLKHCALCAAELRALEQTDRLLDTLEEIEPRRDLVGAVVQHIEREQVTTPAFKRFLTSLRERQWQLQHAAAVVLLVAALGLIVYRSYSPRPAAVVVPRPTAGPTVIYGTAPKSSDTLAEAVAPGKWDIWIPLSESDVKKLNDELRLARDGRVEPSPEASPTSDVIPVEAVIIEPGPDGSLVIKPGQDESGSAIGDPGENGPAN